MPRTNPDSSRVEDLNQGPPDLKSSALNHSATLAPLNLPCLRYILKVWGHFLTALFYTGFLSSSDVSKVYLVVDPSGKNIIPYCK